MVSGHPSSTFQGCTGSVPILFLVAAWWAAAAKPEKPQVRRWQRGQAQSTNPDEERPIALQVEECQGFIERSRNRLMRMEQEQVAEQKELDAALVRLTRLHAEISRSTAAPTQQVAIPVQPDPTTTERRRGRVPQEAREIFVRPFCGHGWVLHWSCLQQETDQL